MAERLFHHGLAGAEPGVEAAFEEGDGLEAHFGHLGGGEFGAGAEGAVDEVGFGFVQGLQVAAVVVEVAGVHGFGDPALAAADFFLHADIKDLEIGGGGDELFGLVELKPLVVGGQGDLGWADGGWGTWLWGAGGEEDQEWKEGSIHDQR